MLAKTNGLSVRDYSWHSSSSFGSTNGHFNKESSPASELLPDVGNVSPIIFFISIPSPKESFYLLLFSFFLDFRFTNS